MKKLLLLFILILSMVVAVTTGAEEKKAAPAEAKKEAPKPEMKAPEPPKPPDWREIKLTDIMGGKEVTLADYVGKGKTMVVFMQTACSACRSEIVFLQAERDKMANFEMVLVSVDIKFDKEKAEKYMEYLRLKDAVFLSDPNFEVPPLFDINSTPAAVLFVDGVKKDKFTGYSAATKKVIKKALK